MREVAGRANVSTSTVSLALRDSPLVAEEIRARIQAVAETLRYKTHPLVAAHMRSRRKPGAGVSAPVLAIVDTQRRRHGLLLRRIPGNAHADDQASNLELP
jgi:DNA-binding LacI/PurR family transcriptional regulator